MSWMREFNSLYTDSFFRFLFGFTVIIAVSFGVIIVVSVVWGESGGTGAPLTAEVAHTR